MQGVKDMKKSHQRISVVVLSFLLLSCAGHGREPMKTVPYVDLERFMGDWHVVANIPTFVEKGAHNAVETYRLNSDGTIATTFRFNKDGFDGSLKTYNPTGFVLDRKTNARWGMQFIWPIKSDYRIIYLDEDYQVTVIGRTKRDYVWVMSRSPNFSDDEFARIKSFIESVGYDASKLQRVPHQDTST
jgi:apolipoprotein D and lipocalin family protein